LSKGARSSAERAAIGAPAVLEFMSSNKSGAVARRVPRVSACVRLLSARTSERPEVVPKTIEAK
jgi:hypothetical protein